VEPYTVSTLQFDKLFWHAECVKKENIAKEILHDHQHPNGIRSRWFEQKLSFLLNIRKITQLN
jgi:hypothetical protein